MDEEVGNVRFQMYIDHGALVRQEFPARALNEACMGTEELRGRHDTTWTRVQVAFYVPRKLKSRWKHLNRGVALSRSAEFRRVVSAFVASELRQVRPRTPLPHTRAAHPASALLANLCVCHADGRKTEWYSS